LAYESYSKKQDSNKNNGYCFDFGVANHSYNHTRNTQDTICIPPIHDTCLGTITNKYNKGKELLDMTTPILDSIQDAIDDICLQIDLPHQMSDASWQSLFANKLRDQLLGADRFQFEVLSFQLKNLSRGNDVKSHTDGLNLPCRSTQ
jgi:hypothetical protein